MNSLAISYKKLLQYSLQHRGIILITSTLLFGCSIFLVGKIRQEFIPPQDQSRFLISVQTPLGSSLAFTEQVFIKGESILNSRPEIERYYVVIGGYNGGVVNQGSVYVTLKEPFQRPIQSPFQHRPSQQELMIWVRNEFNKIQGIERTTGMDLSISGFSSKGGFPIQFSIQGPDLQKLDEFQNQFKERMKKSGFMTDIDSDFKPNMPEIQVIPDRIKAAQHGVSVTNIAKTISAFVGSLKVGKYTDEFGRRNDVRVKLQDEQNRNSTDIKKLPIRNNRGEMVPLSELVTLENKTSLLTINRFNRERAISVMANIVAGKSQVDAMKTIQSIGNEILPPGYHIEMSGSSKTFTESAESLIIALILGVFIAYIVLGIQFNSFIHPITVLLALPFSMTGAFIALWLSGISINMYSMIGILLLLGIVKKNSILLVDFTNIRREEGLGVHEALLDACPLRLRPILMTSIASIAAAIPAALAFGPGAETTRPMAIVVIGGVLLSTLLTLIVIPCAYSLFSRFENQSHKQALREALASLETHYTKPVILLLFLFAPSTYANVESWYWGFDLGWAKPTYSDNINNAISSLMNNSDYARLGLGGGVGIYWPKSNGRTAFGMADSVVVDSFSGFSKSTTITQALLAFSVIHSLGHEFGKGFFIRGDAGLSLVTIKESTSTISTPQVETSNSNMGFGFLIGSGLGISLSESTHLLIEAKYTWMRAAGDPYSSIAICAGPLF